MARVRTLHALALGAFAAAVVAPPASAAGDAPPEASSPMRAPGDTITPLLMETGRPAELTPRSGLFSFSVGGPATVEHRVSWRGRLLGSRTVRCPSGRAWRVRISFDSAAQRRVRRLRAHAAPGVLVWEMTATDDRGNVAHRTVDVPV